MHATDDEAALVEAAQVGDRDAFAALVTRHQEVAFRAAYLVVRDSGGAEDLAQEAFIRAYRSLGSFRAGEPFRPWLLRIVTNLALNEVRARGRRQGLFARFARIRPENAPAPEAEALLNETQRATWRAINELPPDDRVVLYLRYFLDLPEREIATAIGKAPGTVKSRLSRASGRLRAVIDARYPELRRAEPRKGGEDDA